MKFWIKIVISVIAIISIIFSIAGIIIIKSNFKHSLEKTINQNIDSHTLERYGIENNIDINKCYEKVVFLKKYLKEYIKEIKKILILL